MIKIVKFILVLNDFISISCIDKNTIELRDKTKLVNLIIGTDWTGYPFPGATLPNGLVQLSPDTKISIWNNCSGYHYSDPGILGFNHTHYNGTGAAGGGDILYRFQ